MEALPTLPVPNHQNPVLSHVADTTRVALFETGRIVTFDAGSALFADGEPSGAVILPLQGQLQMGKATTRGRRQIICNPTAHSCGGLCMLMFGGSALADTRGLQAGQALIVPREQFETLIHTDPVLCRAAWESAASCMAHLSDLVAQLSFDKVGERVLKALYHGTEKNGDMVRMTQTDLAAEVGTTREVVARCLAGYQEEGLVRLGRARIVVLDRDRMAQAL
jgi:CRP/FNR family transcriptional regulator, cyclic AMP receptor protein